MASWSAGPLPIVQPSNATTARRGHAAATDGAARRTLVAPQQADVLYGNAGLTRQHLIVNEGAKDFRLLALEQLTMPTMDTTLLAVHLAAKPDNADYQDVVAEAVHSPASATARVWDIVSDAIGKDYKIARGPEPPRTINFIDGADDPLVVTAVSSSGAQVQAVGSPR